MYAGVDSDEGGVSELGSWVLPIAAHVTSELQRRARAGGEAGGADLGAVSRGARRDVGDAALADADAVLSLSPRRRLTISAGQQSYQDRRLTGRGYLTVGQRSLR